jgi:hypothetical protein
LNNEDILNIYMYGSRVYETNSDNSDYDYIVVKKGNNDLITQINNENSNITIYDEKSFQNSINEHEISVLECLFLPEKYILRQEKIFNFELNLLKLRESISKKSSNSWVKCKKKLTIPEDYNEYIGKKSLFHSLRILSFGIQIAKYGKIIDYKEANNYWYEIINNQSKDWEHYKEKYQQTFNKLKSEFKMVAPKRG